MPTSPSGEASSSSSHAESDSDSEVDWYSRPTEVLHVQRMPSPPEVAAQPKAELVKLTLKGHSELDEEDKLLPRCSGT